MPRLAATDKRSQQQRQSGPSASIPDLRGLRLHARSTGPNWKLPSCQTSRTLATPHTRVRVR